MLANGQLLSQKRGANTHYYFSDGQHNVRALMDENGIVTDTYDYNAFGEIYAQTGTTQNAYRFAGQQFDPATGLYSMRARYYDPSHGRFLSRDTYAYNYQNPIELNRYGYGTNNPINAYDPTGHFAFFDYSFTNSGLRFNSAAALQALGKGLALNFVKAMMVGALIGGALSFGIEYGNQVYTNYKSGMSITDAVYYKNLDLKTLFYQTAKGSALGAISGIAGWAAGIWGLGASASFLFGAAADTFAGTIWDVVGEGKDFETALAENAAGSFVGGAIGEIGGRIAKAFFKNIGTLPLPNHLDGPSGTVNVPSGSADVPPGGLDPSSGADIPGSGNTPNGQDPTLTGEGNTHPGDSGDGTVDDGKNKTDDENGPGGPKNPCRSFSADTEVATDDGLTPISQLEVGDKVLAYDQNTGVTGEHEITAIGEHTDSVTFLTIDGEVIETTHDHPFYTLERGWTAVENLQPGDHILQADGTYGVVKAVSATMLSQPMFNLTVDTAHTFFVGEGQWLVHNNVCDFQRFGSKQEAELADKTNQLHFPEQGTQGNQQEKWITLPGSQSMTFGDAANYTHRMDITMSGDPDAWLQRNAVDYDDYYDALDDGLERVTRLDGERILISDVLVLTKTNEPGRYGLTRAGLGLFNRNITNITSKRVR